ncbi:MAG: hypothetical protein RMY34_29165 [Aulosira sp. DedQUE10]|nr:hypothetical protein [Aulosira sp. DedQUE10]
MIYQDKSASCITPQSQEFSTRSNGKGLVCRHECVSPTKEAIA